MSETVENLSTLKINYLTQEQYDAAISSGIIQENELYLTPTSGEQSALPSGGLMGQVLAKSSDDDYAVAWATIQSGSSLPSGGTTGQILRKSSSADDDVAWSSETQLVDLVNQGSWWYSRYGTNPSAVRNAVNNGQVVLLREEYNGYGTGSSYYRHYDLDSYTRTAEESSQFVKFKRVYTNNDNLYYSEYIWEPKTDGTSGWNIVNNSYQIVTTSNARLLPSGGIEGQVLAKASSSNYAVAWTTTHDIPAGGNAGQVLAKSSNADYEVAWTTIDAGHGLPSGGTTGQILAKSSNSDYSVAWTSASQEVLIATGSGALTLTVTPDYDEIVAAITAGKIVIFKRGNAYYYYNFTKNNNLYFIEPLDPTVASNKIEYNYIYIYKNGTSTKGSLNSKSTTIPSLPGNLAQSEVWVLRENNSNWQLSNVGIGDISELIDDEDVQSDINRYVMIRKEVSSYNPPTYEALYEDYILCKRYTVYDSDNDVRIGHAVFCSSFAENGTTKVKTIDVASEWGAWNDLATATITFSEAEIGGATLVVNITSNGSTYSSDTSPSQIYDAFLDGKQIYAKYYNSIYRLSSCTSTDCYFEKCSISSQFIGCSQIRVHAYGGGGSTGVQFSSGSASTEKRNTFNFSYDASQDEYTYNGYSGEATDSFFWGSNMGTEARLVVSYETSSGYPINETAWIQKQSWGYEEIEENSVPIARAHFTNLSISTMMIVNYEMVWNLEDNNFMELNVTKVPLGGSISGVSF